MSRRGGVIKNQMLGGVGLEKLPAHPHCHLKWNGPNEMQSDIASFIMRCSVVTTSKHLSNLECHVTTLYCHDRHMCGGKSRPHRSSVMDFQTTDLTPDKQRTFDLGKLPRSNCWSSPYNLTNCDPWWENTMQTLCCLIFPLVTKWLLFLPAIHLNLLHLLRICHWFLSAKAKIAPLATQLAVFSL